MAEIPTTKPNLTKDIDINNPNFYEKVQSEIESDLARIKKAVEVIMNLRLTAAEIEVEAAALYHAELWYNLLDIHNIPDVEEDEDMLNKDDKK